MCFSSMQTEFWWRYYVRWQKGFRMSSQKAQKLIYSADSANRPYIDTYGDDGIRVIGGTCDGSNCNATSGVWRTMMGGDASDGNWHELQFHLKGGGSGEVNIWVDGRHVLHARPSWSIQGWKCFKFPENVDSASNATTMFQDIDDIAVSTTGYIPSIVPATGSLSLLPPPPQNLIVH